MTKGLVGFEDFLEKLSEIKIEEMDLPKLYIPNWPKKIRVRIKLGRKEYIRPVEGTGSYMLVREKKRLTFRIYGDGSLGFCIRKGWNKEEYWSDNNYKSDRMTAIILFNQFKEEIYPRVIKRLKKIEGEHNQVIEEAKKAFEPFIPHLAAEKLSD